MLSRLCTLRSQRCNLVGPQQLGKAFVARRRCTMTAILPAEEQSVAGSVAAMSVNAEDPKVVTKATYDALCKKLKEISALEGISGLLGWDEMVMMPPGASASRATQKECLAGVIYEKRTEAEMGRLLAELKGVEMEAIPAAVVREATRDFTQSTALPKSLVQRSARLQSEGHHAWVEARSTNDWSKFAPCLTSWVAICKEKAAFIDPSRPAYDVLVDEYEKGMTTERLEEVFTKVREGLIPLIADIKSKGEKLSADWLKGEYDVEKQAELCKSIAKDIGFNTEMGRLDVSVHPFTGGAHPTDVRMTTRFKKTDLMEGITGAVHETGHSLYEQGRNQEYDGLPVNAAMSLGIHESQSLLWERMVCLSPEFSHYLLPKLKEAFPGKFDDVEPTKLYTGINVIQEPSLIRVEADEVTYPMHIIIRFEMEKALVDGSLAVEDVPRVWNEKMVKYLGCAPPSDAQGCLQDIHWSMGALGYFPTYTLGAMYATQIFIAARKEIPDLDTLISKGEFAPLKTWLNAKIHAVGSLHTNGDELMKAVTGHPLDPSVFLDYLKTKYTALYKLPATNP